MHGIIFCELKQFVEKKFGAHIYVTIVESANVQGNYAPFRAYPDADFMALIGALSAETRREIPELVETFGRHLAPILANARLHLSLSGIHSCPIVNPEWGLMELLEEVEEVVHTLIKRTLPQSTPAFLSADRQLPNRVVISYTSKRKLCWLGKGIIYGLADLYKTSVTVTEPMCMHRGDKRCELIVTKN